MSEGVNELIRGCPNCNMAYSMFAPLARKEKEFQCSVNPSHKFLEGSDGFLKSI